MKKEDFLKYYETDKITPMIFTNIDFEEVILKKINEDYEIEISCYKNKNINLYLWKNHSIVGTILHGERGLYRYYEDMFKKICIEIGQEIRIDFKHKTINIFENKEENKMLRKFEFVERVKSTGYEMKEPGFDLPKRSTKKSAGYDFINPERVEIPPYKIGSKPIMVKTGVKVYMPDDEYLMLVNRSSNPKKKFLVIPNSLGIVDADYVDNPDNEGEMMFAFYNLSEETVVIEKGEKLGQGIFAHYGITDDDNAEGDRVGGFGSTGK